MSSTTNDQTMSALQQDVASLKQDIGSLLTHLKSSAAAGVQSAAGQVEDQASSLYHSATAEGCKTAKALGRHIEEQPVLTLLVVLGLGYLGGRLLTR